MSDITEVVKDIREAESPIEILSSYENLIWLMEKEVYIKRKEKHPNYI